MIQIKGIKILENNIVWILYKKNECIIIDPGLADPIIYKLKKYNLKPIFIFITHLHDDHINGLFKIIQFYSKILIITPKKIKKINKKNQIIISHIKKIIIFNKIFTIFSTPGHTNNDISYFIYPYLFCGDILFSGGCGNTLNGGNTVNLYYSLKKIINLPNKTFFFNSHEYTLSNLNFAHKFLKKDILIQDYLFFFNKNYKFQKNYNNLNFEKKINIFLRIKEKKIKEAINYWYKSENEIEYFCNLRKIKDEF
ncbi:MBL fold metallo-hydrolase [Buchnera aphidicola]|uniref:MBL fold metallo-hydrolase n=1 Tax=Buchnera aphidicola TaxID=9 RepID=UPI0022374210|nr:MBL fold metallo-hydrolase [Buchnera aphidicola]MCW5197666.1 MBL fold metallo-hydrolase [Buchnera aphidicola (Chaitophorus viminalis)]